MQDHQIKETPTEARQAIKVGAMRYVLGVGIAGTVLGFLVAWFIFGG